MASFKILFHLAFVLTIFSQSEATLRGDFCSDVSEMKCQAVAWVECKPDPNAAAPGGCHEKYKDFELKKCKTVTENIPHKKKVPECRTVTKQNCDTEWDVDDNGNKVWTGRESCSPVSWEECDLVEKEVDFAAEKTECFTAGNVKYLDFEDCRSNSDAMVNKCEVKKGVSCKPVKSNKCATVRYQDCSVKPDEECAASRPVYVPEQEKVHQKKCLT